MEQKQERLDSLRQLIVEHILSTRQDFNNYSLIERFECAQTVINLTKDYCCELFGIDKSKVKTCFIHGSEVGGVAGGKISDVGFSAMALTTKKVLTATSIYDFYKTALHEFRHLHQINNLPPENRETLSHYIARGKFNRFKWASSPSEAGADRFAFSQLLGLQRAVLKQPVGRVKAGAEYLKWCDRSLTSSAEHFAAGVAYGVLKPFIKGSMTRHIGDRIDTPKDANDQTKMLTLFDIKNMADINPELYSPKAFNPKDKSLQEEFATSTKGYIEIKEWMEGGMKGMPFSGEVNADLDGLTNSDKIVGSQQETFFASSVETENLKISTQNESDAYIKGTNDLQTSVSEEVIESQPTAKVEVKSENVMQTTLTDMGGIQQ